MPLPNFRPDFTTTQATVSILIPAFNAARHIGEAVRSVHNQKQCGPIALEILVVDDGSSDDTATVAEKLGCSVLRRPHRGTAAARNLALDNASGELILFLDADDVLEPSALTNLYAAFSADNDLQVAMAMAEDFISPELAPDERTKILPRPEPYFGMLTGCTLLRRSTVDRVGHFSETLPSGETVAWLLSLQDLLPKTVHLPVVALRRRLHLNNTGRRLRQKEWNSYATILRSRLAHNLATEKN
ncbi:MAG: glycosyltransferase family 2 protein [Puniceicoccales bacterium]|jgi:glycosyltransferase involved in cell wall biosynthesis|nr:glycosyltransferase family 2 protein [Puniceicoccales bacterium]